MSRATICRATMSCMPRLRVTMSCHDVVPRLRATMSCHDFVPRCRATMWHRATTSYHHVAPRLNSCHDVAPRLPVTMSCRDVVPRCRATIDVVPRLRATIDFVSRSLKAHYNGEIKMYRQARGSLPARFLLFPGQQFGLSSSLVRLLLFPTRPPAQGSILVAWVCIFIDHRRGENNPHRRIPTKHSILCLVGIARRPQASMGTVIYLPHLCAKVAGGNLVHVPTSRLRQSSRWKFGPCTYLRRVTAAQMFGGVVEWDRCAG